ncbi:MerR family transcriptional regulator [Parasphingorhabdus flavimaris]|jgi:DNA-binding transcriptional MerR regulator|uniref:MerR family transcriptional regulator n=1 Tax=Parasphingorhabdus flavimaris TaxID=266812 RepID=A0ABX2N2U4_9SPHN|nr:MerR family transcriptional regulator [Parasphingorhabdus flavimaris]NVD28035.1 MerR family transcriptional regulator [Parasphingorhabdus flavimaris]|tara:strand:- start:1432 stop:1818 length:387 start_codon:yes stop_codon:yes gene_type:complete
MTKEQGAFRTIGELSKELSIKPHILRYWEDQFAMLTPLKRAGARRHYRPEDVIMVKTINRLLNEEGYTIKGARKFLASRRKGPEMVEDAPQAAAASLPLMTGDAPDNGVILAELKAIRDRLSHALDAA